MTLKINLFDKSTALLLEQVNFKKVKKKTNLSDTLKILSMLISSFCSL